jgi:Lrp/AsnC family transcriptional regulator, leucine-responsive regulatory protein
MRRPVRRGSPRRPGPVRRSRTKREPIVRRGPHRRPVEPLDRLDVAILAALQSDGRASLRRVARHVGASVTTVSSRVRSLERLGVLQGFVPLVSVQRLALLGRSPDCVVLHIVPRDRSAEGVEGVAREVARESAVCYLFQLAGSPELMALASSVSARATERLVSDVSAIPGVQLVRPVSITHVHKERPGHPVGPPVPGRAVPAWVLGP